jgi:hypothetical protein
MEGMSRRHARTSRALEKREEIRLGTGKFALTLTLSPGRGNRTRARLFERPVIE